MRKLEEFKEDWWKRNPNAVDCENYEDTEGGISISNIGGVFIVIFVGIGLAVVTLVFEFWFVLSNIICHIVQIQRSGYKKYSLNLRRP